MITREATIYPHFPATETVLRKRIPPPYKELLGRCISFVINGAVGLKNAEVPVEVLKKLDPERAGIATKLSIF